MTPNLCIAVSAPTLRALLDFHSEHSNEIDLADLADLAIRDRLRVSNHMITRYAAVVGDDLVHETMMMSPNRFAQMTLGSARNAWEVVYIQMPGQREWKQALRLRCALEADERWAVDRPAAPTPAPAVAPPRVSAAPAPQRSLPAGVLHAPQLRSDCEERRKVSRRAEDLLLD